MITAVPPPVPSTTPLELPTSATAPFPLVHDPPGLGSVSDSVKPWQTAPVPDIPDGGGFTVNVTVLPLDGLIEQVPLLIFVMVSVVDPVLPNTELVNVPVPLPPIVSVAVFPTAVFAPERS